MNRNSWFNVKPLRKNLVYLFKHLEKNLKISTIIWFIITISTIISISIYYQHIPKDNRK